MEGRTDDLLPRPRSWMLMPRPGQDLVFVDPVQLQDICRPRTAKALLTGASNADQSRTITRPYRREVLPPQTGKFRGRSTTDLTPGGAVESELQRYDLWARRDVLLVSQGSRARPPPAAGVALLQSGLTRLGWLRHVELHGRISRIRIQDLHARSPPQPLSRRNCAAKTT